MNYSRTRGHLRKEGGLLDKGEAKEDLKIGVM